MWNVDSFVIPVIIEVHGNCKQRTKRNLELISGKDSINSLQNTTVLGTSHNCYSLTHIGSREVPGERKHMIGDKDDDHDDDTGDNTSEMYFLLVLHYNYVCNLD
jgi:hypothetical protein